MLVRPKICVEMASKVWGDRVKDVDPFVMFERELSGSLRVGMFCKASIVADVGVFSPRMAFGGGLVDGLRHGVSRSNSLALGVGVPERTGLRSGDLFSLSNVGVRGILSGDRSGDFPPSK